MTIDQQSRNIDANNGFIENEKKYMSVDEARENKRVLKDFADVCALFHY